ncbi:MAG: isochorismatase family protein [Peptoniphilus sp.]|nr:isochorismatase family protein [Peptoniphilus sp.]
MKNFKLNRDDVIFLFIDIQDKLLKAIDNREGVLKYSKILAEVSDIMNMDKLVTVQYAKGLGHTNGELMEILEADEIDKKTFSCMLNEEFKAKLEEKNKKQVILSGIESHICVLLTARDLIAAGYEVFVAADAVGSRSKFNYHNSLDLMRDMGCVITNTESILFDLNSLSGTDEFKKVQNLIK